jgi:hypothetical protein
MKKIDKKKFLFGHDDWLFSLNRFTGKKVADITGYPSDPFGGTPIFKICQIVFEDGTAVFVEGEHDVPYIPSDEDLKDVRLDEETLQSFIEQDDE